MSDDRESFRPGTYLLFNKQHGTTLTLESDHRTVSAAEFDPAGTLYQMWTFIPTETIGEYLIRSAAQSPDGRQLYITFDRVLRDRTAVIAGTYPVPWSVGNQGRKIIMGFANTELLLKQGSRQGKVQLLALMESQDYLEAKYSGGDSFSLWDPYTWNSVAVRLESREDQVGSGATRTTVTII